MDCISQARRRKIGQKLYVVAWVIEGIAVSAGLLIAVAIGMDAHHAAGGHGLSLDVVLASGGFLVVACAELTKIPVATTLVHARWTWKPVLFVLLALMSVITFETIFFSLERGFTMRMQAVERQRQAVEELEDERSRLMTDLARSKEAATDTQVLLVGPADELRRRTAERVEELKAELATLDLNALPPAALDLDRRIAERRQAIGDLRDLAKTERNERIDRFESQRESYLRRIEDARKAGDERSVRKWEQALEKLPYPKKELDEIQKRHGVEISKVEAQIVELRQQRAALDITPSADLVARRRSLQERIDEAYDDQRALEREQGARAAERSEKAAARLDAVALTEERLRVVEKNLVPARAAYLELSELDQIYRIAAFWFGKAPAEIGSHEAKQVAAFWFGSIAALAALAGAATAILGEGLIRLSEPRPRQRRAMGLAGLLRRLLLSWRWQRVRTVERFVAGPPVEKVVEKIVDKIVERPVKEFIYVPLLTDDPDAVRSILERDLPRGVGEILKPSAWGDGHAVPA